MATRSVTHFISPVYRNDPEAMRYVPSDEEFITRAIVYKHYDGYPEVTMPQFRRFLDRAKRLTDSRFTDPSYLAAKWVVFLAEEYAESYDSKKGKFVPNEDRLEFLAVGVVLEEPMDIEYRWFVDCRYREGEDEPRIGFQVVPWDGTAKRNAPAPTRYEEVNWIDPETLE